MSKRIEHRGIDDFRTPDGQQLRTWNMARRALTRLDLIAFIEEGGIPHDQAVALADRLLANWRVSIRSNP